jgi:hypothetical protein
MVRQALRPTLCHRPHASTIPAGGDWVKPASRALLPKSFKLRSTCMVLSGNLALTLLFHLVCPLTQGVGKSFPTGSVLEIPQRCAKIHSEIVVLTGKLPQHPRYRHLLWCLLY